VRLPRVRPTSPAAESARRFVAEADFLWHQRFELAEGVVTPGMNDLGRLFEACDIPSDLSGRTALDIGTANGGGAFELERRGARRVVAVDIYPPRWFGFDRTRAFLGSSVEYQERSLYTLSELGETFDIVLFWGVLYHLRHPLLGLDNLRAVVGEAGAGYVETAVADHLLGRMGDQPLARFYRGSELAGDGSNWFLPTVASLEDWCRSSGLEPTVLKEWPGRTPDRVMAKVSRIEGDPEYFGVSYERELAVRPLAGPYVPERAIRSKFSPDAPD